MLSPWGQIIEPLTFPCGACCVDGRECLWCFRSDGASVVPQNPTAGAPDGHAAEGARPRVPGAVQGRAYRGAQRAGPVRLRALRHHRPLWARAPPPLLTNAYGVFRQ